MAVQDGYKASNNFACSPEDWYDWENIKKKVSPLRRDPLPTDDHTKGYNIFSFIVNVANLPRTVWFCTNPEENAAVWVNLSATVLGSVTSVNGVSGEVIVKFLQDMLISAISISALRLLTTDSNGNLIYASNSILLHADSVIGMSTNSVSALGVSEFVTGGIFEDSSWDFGVGDKLYLGANGFITNIAPVSPTATFSQQVGYAMTNKKIKLDIQKSIILI